MSIEFLLFVEYAFIVFELCYGRLECVIVVSILVYRFLLVGRFVVIFSHFTLIGRWHIRRKVHIYCQLTLSLVKLV